MGRRLAARPRARRGLRRLRAHRVGRVPDPVAGGPAVAGAGGREGHVLDQDPRARHARARLAAVPHRQRARHRGGSGTAHRRVPAPDPDPRLVAAVRRGDALRPRDHRCAPEHRRLRRRAVGAPARDRAALARVHAHHVRADRRARWHQDQRDPRPGRSRSRHPHAPRTERRRRHRDAARGARRPRRRGRHHVERRSGDVVARRHATVGFAGPHERAAVRGFGAGAVADGGRYRQPVLPALPARSVTASACSRSGFPTRTSPRCSTATTNVSTRSRWRCRRGSGKRSRATSWAECRVRRSRAAPACGRARRSRTRPTPGTASPRASWAQPRGGRIRRRRVRRWRWRRPCWPRAGPRPAG